ncbi:histidinol-phosphate transaminase [Ahniella affigens]|uniref:Histidinol-phosphate aminotransferase n=1 Tax=Ahniella affigens TaxID=2021234 RepID=A0A2P1PPZ8_9GAMM|nr:histidinol-phosphate transaminase [Ahniella affigens]AVP96917.1 histidinol-phosphate transaminase [Ahniella affigens]
MSILNLARPDILAMTGYSSARMEAAGGRIFLNANEAPTSPIDGEPCNRYPEPQPDALRAAVAQYLGVTPPQCLVGRGSDEAIDLLTRAFCRAGEDAVLISPPTFGMYAVCARIQNARVLEVPASATAAFAYPLDDALAALASDQAGQIKLVYLCSPNNPTGQVVPTPVLDAMLAATRGRAVLVVDEAYQEFADTPSALTRLPEAEHLVVLRTLSKAHGLAGERLGIAIAAPEIIALLQKIMAPYPLPQSSVARGLSVLAPAALTRTAERIAMMNAERERLRARLADSPLLTAVLPSDANFLAVRCLDAAALYQDLLSQGIVLRSLQKYPGLGDALRISIGTPAENDALLAALGCDLATSPLVRTEAA